MSKRLKGQVTIVTGGAQGIGKAIVEAFDKQGATVIIVDVADAAGQAVALAGKRRYFHHCDVSNKAAIEQLVSTIVDKHGRIDCVVNNAGILKTGNVLEITEADFDAVIAVNLKGALFLSQAAGKQMVKQGKGNIINMSSVNGQLTIPTILPYNVSKGGLDQLTRVMAVSLAHKGIRVNAIGPGSILTEMLEKVMLDDTARKNILSRTPMGRCGNVEEIAQIAVFLASDDSSYITGECIYADGGRMGLNYTVPVKD